MLVWTQQLSGQLIFTNSACQAQMPTFSTSSQVVAELSHTQGSATAPQPQTVSSPNPSTGGTGCITLLSTGSLLSQKNVVFYTLQQKCMAKVNVFYKNDQAKPVLLWVTDRHSCSREASSSAGDEKTWWGYQRLSMVTVELKTNLQLRRATQV